jgi:drug/metabolite transporter (DMT)-like permease
VIGMATQRIGVAVASVANKLSLVIPFIFSVILYNEDITILKIAGIAVALVAVVLTCYPQKGQKDAATGRLPQVWLFMLPVIIFIGSGLLDTMIKYVEQAYLNDSNKDEYLITSFSTAAAIGVVALAIKLLSGKTRLSYRSVLAGIMIGVPNYFSIWCLLQVLKQHAGNSSAIIPINNMGIVLFSAVMAWLLFKEKLWAWNWVGILLALGAIALIAYG